MKERYIQFPLCLFMETYLDPLKGIHLILNYGIVNYAKKFKYDISEVAIQLMYCYYRNQEMIQFELLETIQDYIDTEKLSIDPDYSGFDNTIFEPLDGSPELLGLLESDQEFRDSAILLYQIRQAVSEDNLSLDITIENVISQYETGKKIQERFEQQFGKDVMPSIKIDQIFEFIDSLKLNDSFNKIDYFRAYIGIKSLIGRNTFTTTNKPAILSRMIGCKSKAAFEYYTLNRYNKRKELLPTVEKFSKKYQMDKLLLNLAQLKFIMFLSKPKVSVLYISQFMEPEKLAEVVKQGKESRDLKNRIRNATASI